MVYVRNKTSKMIFRVVKGIFLFLVILTPALATGQISEINKKKDLRDYQDSIKHELELTEEMITMLEDSVSLLLGSMTAPNPAIPTTVNSNTYLRKERKAFGQKVVSIPKGDSIQIVEIEGQFYYCKYKEYSGYLLDIDVSSNEKLSIFKTERTHIYQLKSEIGETEEKKLFLQEELTRVDEVLKFRDNFIQPYNETGTGLTISAIGVSEINSANGVSITMGWAHIMPEKIIKYLDVYLTPFNAVGDPVKCAIRGNSQFKGRVTGPVYFDYTFQNSTWESAWYNNTVRCIRLDRVDVYYTDGSKYVYIKELPKLYGTQFKNDCSFK